MKPSRSRSVCPVSGQAWRGPGRPRVLHLSAAGRVAARPGARGRPLLWRQLVGSALRRARLRRAWTLRDLAAAARVSLAYLSEIERGRKEVSSEILAAICRALGLRLSDLLEEVMQELVEQEPAVAPPPRARDAHRRAVRRRRAFAPKAVSGREVGTLS